MNIHAITAVLRRNGAAPADIRRMQELWTLAWDPETRDEYAALIQSCEAVAGRRVVEISAAYVTTHPTAGLAEAASAPQEPEEEQPGPETPGEPGTPGSAQPEPAQEPQGEAAPPWTDADLADALVRTASVEAFIAEHPDAVPALRELEQARPKPRKGVLAALDRAAG